MPQVGLDCYMYYNSGTLGSPTWNLITLARDVTLGMGAMEADAKTRGSALAAALAAHIEVEINFDMLYDTTDTVFNALLTVFLARGEVELALMDGPIATTGSQGPRVACSLFKFDRGEPLDDSLVMSVTAKPTYGAAFTWLDIA